ncbi:hypothetical protein AGMMS49983_08360 [Clostridia bacterium]|nr:hypothetical protein AGMMS49983_08360 [Clostridia bacterium]
MRKTKKFSILVCIILVAGILVAGCTTQQPSTSSTTDAGSSAAAAESNDGGSTKGLRIGSVWPDLTNAVWAEITQEQQVYGKAEFGAEVTIVQYGDDASKAVEQIENFVQAGYDAIVITPQDGEALEDAAKAAMDKGVVVVCHGVTMENVNFNYRMIEYDTGYEAGKAAADWIDTRPNVAGKDEIQVAFCNYPKIPTVIDRENGFEDAIKERYPNVNVVMRAEALTQEEGMNAAETFFQAYPNLDIIYSIGDGGGLGANEAAKAAGKVNDDFGIFCVDGTESACNAIYRGESIRATISIGGGKFLGRTMIDLVMAGLNGESLEKNQSYVHVPITIDNVEDYAAEQNYTLTKE